jgi:WhiB family redox-sensing transcriptional regulator
MSAMRRLVIDPDEWVLAAACRGSQTLFFAPDDAAETKSERRRREAQAKAVCQGCMVRMECLSEAVGSRERFGIWGGLTERERRALGRRTNSPQDIAGPGRPLSLPAVVVQGRPMSPDA